MLKLPGLFFVTLWGFTTVSAAEKEVELVTDAEFIQPTSTFEFRFATPVVGREEVGTVASNPPIKIEPAIAGTFTWLSQRSGVFVPTAPPPLGAGLVVTIRSDFRDLSGKPIGQAFRAVLKTPPYGITSVVAPQEDEINPKPEVRLALNLDTVLDPSRFRFVSASGHEAAAKVRYATEEDYFEVPVEDLDWNRRWTESVHAGAGEPRLAEATEGNPPSAEATEGKPLMDRIVVTPVDPLEANQDWRLEIAAGLKSVSGMSDNQARAGTFGLNSYLAFDFPVACKTGTSSNYRDNWTFGFTPEFTVGAWVGNPDNSSMRGITGVTGAAPIFHEIMVKLRDRYGTSWYHEPSGIEHCYIDPPGTASVSINHARFRKSMPSHLNPLVRKITILPVEPVCRKIIEPG
jgi:hypothetical protein